MLLDEAQLSGLCHKSPLSSSSELEIKKKNPGSTVCVHPGRTTATEQVPLTSKNAQQKLGDERRRRESAGVRAVTGGGRCPLRKHPAERRRQGSQAHTGTVGGSCAAHWRAGFACVRARAGGRERVRACGGARTWEKDTERERERESVRCSV